METEGALKHIIDRIDLTADQRVFLACEILWGTEVTASSRQLIIDGLHPSWVDVVRKG